MAIEMSETDERLRLKRMETLQALKLYMGSQKLIAAKDCGQRLLSVTREGNGQSDITALVAYGGGKDSSYVVSFIRFVQLLLLEEYGSTFQLRVVTNRHAGMPQAVMENIHRVYQALSLYHEPAAELYLVQNDSIEPFHVDCPLSPSVVERNRLDILMTGHRCQGDARPTFCNACNMMMVKSFNIASSHKGGVSLIITGDSDKERKAYNSWVSSASKKLGIPKQNAANGFTNFMHQIEALTDHYFRDIYGDLEEEISERRIKVNEQAKVPTLFSIYEETAYRATDHWPLLTEFLGFQFDEIAFSFTETDCGNPALMAHLRGLKAERLYRRKYEEGLAEYIEFATALMRKKEFPQSLIRIMEERYHTIQSIEKMRGRLSSYAQESYRINEEQIVCMLYSPFTQRCSNLKAYLEYERPSLLSSIDEIHTLLSQEEEGPKSTYLRPLKESLEKLSGLTIKRLRVLYNSTLISTDAAIAAGRKSPISVILERDPHKAYIETRHAPEGPIIREMITGR